MAGEDLEAGLIVGQAASNGAEERHRADICTGAFLLDGVHVQLSLSREGLEWKPTGATGKFCGCFKMKEGEGDCCVGLMASPREGFCSPIHVHTHSIHRGFAGRGGTTQHCAVAAVLSCHGMLEDVCLIGRVADRSITIPTHRHRAC